MDRIGQNPATTNTQRNGRFGLLPPDPLARLTRRAEKQSAVNRIGNWNRQIKDKRFMRNLLEEVRKKRGKKRSDIWSWFIPEISLLVIMNKKNFVKVLAKILPSLQKHHIR